LTASANPETGLCLETSAGWEVESLSLSYAGFESSDEKMEINVKYIVRKKLPSDINHYRQPERRTVRNTEIMNSHSAEKPPRKEIMLAMTAQAQNFAKLGTHHREWSLSKKRPRV
jgi:hypothetical protein